RAGQAVASDTTPPTLQSFEISPGAVDTTGGPATVTLTARISDDLSGVAASGAGAGLSQLAFQSPSGTASVLAVFYDGFNLISGTRLDGTYSRAVTIPQFAESGTWSLSHFLLYDQAGNVQSLTAAQVAALGFPTSFVVNGRPALAWTPSPIVYGTPLGASQLNATASVVGSFTYTPAAGTLLDAGLHLLSVTFTPADTGQFATVTTTVTLSVEKATPVITWSPPAPISVGTPLSAAQLNATANVPGSFTYTPAVGTVLAEGGNQSLTVAFTPSDASNYVATSKTV